MRTVVFDLDGTLADTSGDLIAAANACFRQLGHKDILDPVADRLTAFGGGRAMLRRGFDRLDQPWVETDIDHQYQQLLNHYGANINRHTFLYPGVKATLAKLSALGFALGVCTNKPAYLAEELLRRLAIRDCFGAVLGADSLPVRKPDPEHLFETIRRLGGTPERSILVGDTITDRNTAYAANVPCILVAFGPLGKDVRSMQPDAMLEHFSTLPELAMRLIPA